MQDKPRYSRISDVLDLAVFMRSQIGGITIFDIMERYNVSRRTAIRMRDSLLNIFPNIDVIKIVGSRKYWGFVSDLNSMIFFNSDELANLENILKRTTNKEAKFQLKKTIEKLYAINNKKISSNEDIQLLMQVQGYAVRQAPKYKVDFEMLESVKNALIKNIKLEGIYNDKKRILEPLGLIYGEKTYLIAKEKAKGDDIYTYTLHKFQRLDLSCENFEKPEFNLQEYANKSFGVYHGEILDVELVFEKESVQKALNYYFHPTQKMQVQKDGSLLVNFSASGEREIMYNLFRWGKNCKIIKPERLKIMYTEYLKEVLNNYLV